MNYKHSLKSSVGFGADWRLRRQHRACLNKVKFNCGDLAGVWNLVHVLCKHMKRTRYVHIQQKWKCPFARFVTPQKERKDSNKEKAEIESGSERKKTNPDINGPVVRVIFISVFVFHSKWMADATRWAFNNSRAATTNSTHTRRSTHFPVRTLCRFISMIQCCCNPCLIRNRPGLLRSKLQRDKLWGAEGRGNGDSFDMM